MPTTSIFQRGAAGLLLLGLAAQPSAAQTACSVSLQAGEERNITARQGDTITVCLPLNSGTGYSWQVQMGSDASTLNPAQATERGGTQPGAPAVTRFTMKASPPGDYTLIFMLVPPGTTGAEAGRALVGLKVQ